MDDPSKQLPFYQQPWFKIGVPTIFLLGLYLGLYVWWPPANMMPFVMDVLAFGMALAITLALASQFVLPVRSMHERVEAMNRMFGYVSGGHGPIVFVRDGQMMGNVEELKRKGEGVILVDGFSAVLLEKGGRYSRAAGPGLVFTHRGESVAATFDLRKQSRSQQTQVLMKDGIEIKLNVSVTFSLDPTPAKKDEKGKETKDILGDAKITPATEFNPESAFKAHYGFAVIDKDTQIKWMELPIVVATEYVRDHVSRVNLDDMFLGRDGGQPMTSVIQSRLTSDVQNAPLLKDRGIKIYSAGMSIAELPEAVNEQRKRSWSVRWRKEVVVAQGESDVEVERIKELAKAEAQNEMYKHIREYRTEILNDNGDPDTKKMIAKKLVDGLHRLASDPTTHILLPGDTMRQLANLRHWVGLPDVDEESMLQLSEGQPSVAPSEDLSEVAASGAAIDVELPPTPAPTPPTPDEEKAA